MVDDLDSAADVAAQMEFESTVDPEFDRWAQARSPVQGGPQVHPVPDSADGLPYGWDCVGDPDTTALRGERFYLVRRRTGGWLIVRYSVKKGHSRIHWYALTLAQLVHALTEEATGHDPGEVPALLGWVRGVIDGLYDPADPGDAAERTMFALSGRLQRLPRILDESAQRNGVDFTRASARDCT